MKLRRTILLCVGLFVGAMVAAEDKVISTADQLEAQGQNRHDLGREKFLEKVWEWKDQSGGNISRQIRRLGSSVDWACAV